MTHRSRPRSKSLPIDKIVFFVSIAFLVSCVIVAIQKERLHSGGDASGLPASHAENGRLPAADTSATSTDDGDRAEGSPPPGSGWPKVDRDRLRFGVVQDVADALALGKYSGLVSLSTETEQRLFDDWSERAAAWSDRWNKDPVLYADGTDQSGARLYRIELHGEELGRVHVTRYANGWNIVGVERKVTGADLLAEERILREAAARAGVARDPAEVKASTSSKTTSQEREEREQ